MDGDAKEQTQIYPPRQHLLKEHCQEGPTQKPNQERSKRQSPRRKSCSSYLHDMSSTILSELTSIPHLPSESLEFSSKSPRTISIILAAITTALHIAHSFFESSSVVDSNFWPERLKIRKRIALTGHLGCGEVKLENAFSSVRCRRLFGLGK